MAHATDGYVPEPMTAHPHYSSQAEGIRSMLAQGRPIFVAEPRRLTAFAFEDAPPLMESAINKRVLEVKKCAGPAPFVGDPLWEDGWYSWHVAVDDLGRHVAGDAVLEIIQRPTRAY